MTFALIFCVGTYYYYLVNVFQRKGKTSSKLLWNKNYISTLCYDDIIKLSDGMYDVKSMNSDNHIMVPQMVLRLIHLWLLVPATKYCEHVCVGTTFLSISAARSHTFRVEGMGQTLNAHYN